MTEARTQASADDPYVVRNDVRAESCLPLVESLVVSNLASALGSYCDSNRLGRTLAHASFTVPPSGNNRKLGVAFVSFQRWPADRPAPRVNAWPVAPDLAVEVISPTDKAFDVIEKVQEYFSGGVRQVWHVYSHTEQVFVFDSPTTVRVLTRADELTAEPVVPGFRMAMADLFPLAEPHS